MREQGGTGELLLGVLEPDYSNINVNNAFVEQPQLPFFLFFIFLLPFLIVLVRGKGGSPNDI